MILQALSKYYERMAADPESGIAPEGLERKSIPFLVIIDENGKFINLEDTRVLEGKKLIPKTFLIPRSKSRTGVRGYETVNLLWDHIGYLFCHPKDDEKAKNQHHSWLNYIHNLPDKIKNIRGVSAMIKFYQSEEEIKAVKAHPSWADCLKTSTCNMMFQLVGELNPIPCLSEIHEYAKQSASDSSDSGAGEGEENIIARCLVTGRIGKIVRVHSDTRINKDAKKLVGFQKNSGYDSYGKEQGFNAPVCTTAEFAYTTALNTLIKSQNRLWVGDTLILFWAASIKDTDFERLFYNFFGEVPKDNPELGPEAVKSLFRSIESGVFQGVEDRKFYILGLAPNSARIAVRLWIGESISKLSKRIAQYFYDLSITHHPNLSDFLSMPYLMKSIALREESKNISPMLPGEVMYSILQGLPLPNTLLQAALRRIRAEHSITYPRAALIKACINRATRVKNPTIKEELNMSLDEQNTNIGYRLGRLFATLEKIQSESHPGINATIRDRFYGSASGTPITVFGNLMRLKNHHLAKLENPGRRVNFERLISSILDGVEAKKSFPSHLSLEDQGRFAVGYYHQMQDFFMKKENKNQGGNHE